MCLASLIIIVVSVPAPLTETIDYVSPLVLGLDNRNINNRYRYSTFSDNRYRNQISICTYAHVHSVHGIFFLKTS